MDRSKNVFLWFLVKIQHFCQVCAIKQLRSLPLLLEVMNDILLIEFVALVALNRKIEKTQLCNHSVTVVFKAKGSSGD